MCSLCVLGALCVKYFYIPSSTSLNYATIHTVNEKTPPAPPERNPKTHAAHRKQVWWQITLPLVIGCLLLALAFVGVIWAAAGANDQVSRWADISLICLTPLPIFFGLLGLGVLIGLTILTSKLLSALPGFAWRVHLFFAYLQQKTLKASNGLVAPALRLKGWTAAARRARQVVTQPLRPSRPLQDEHH